MPERLPPSRELVRGVIVVVATLVVLYGVYLVRQILVLVIVAAFLAIGLDPVVRSLGRFRLPRPAAVAVVFAAAMLVIAAFVASVTPPLVRQTQRLAQTVPEIAADVAERSDRFAEWDERYDISARIRSSLDELPSVAAGSAGSALGVVRSIGAALFNLFTVAILTIYFLLDLPKLIAGAATLVPASRRRRAQDLAEVVFGRISGYMVGQLGISLVAGLTSIIALTLLGVPYPLALGMWVGLAALIPMVGATLGAIPAVIVAFFTSVPMGVGTLVFFAIYQQLENYVVAPRVMRSAVDISAAAVILAALIGATLLGFVGALLAIPVAASLKVITQELWISQQETA